MSEAARELWIDRYARMRPQHSRMEQWLLIELNKRGFHPFVDIPFVVRINGRDWRTIPDFDFREVELRLEVYVDGEKAHRKRQHRDEQIRQALLEQYMVDVLSITYRGNSKREKSRVLNKILEAVEG